MKKVTLVLSILFLVVISTVLYAQASKSAYQIVNKIHLEGDGGWDYPSVDENGGRLYLSHGNIVQVVDLKEGKLAGTIPDTKGVHGIAFASDLNKGFISAGRDTAVIIFKLDSLEVTAKVQVTGRNPDAILYDPFSHYVFAYNGGTKNATVIDGKTDKVIATIELGGKPEFSASNGKGWVFVNIEDKNLVNVINTKTLKVIKSWPIKPGEEPSGMAIDNINNRLFIVCGESKTMVVVDSKTGKVITSLPIGDRVDGAAFDPTLKRAYSSNGDGTITVVQEISKNEFKVLENVETPRGARTITIDSKSHHLYLPTAEFEAAPAPAPDTQNAPRRRPSIKPGSFYVLDIAPVNN